LQHIPGTFLVKSVAKLKTFDSGFRNSYRFSRNQVIGVKVPKWWAAGECIIIVTCSNNFDSDTFSYRDVLTRAKKIVDQVCNLMYSITGEN